MNFHYRCVRKDGTAYLTPEGKATPNAGEAETFTSAFIAAAFILDIGCNPMLWTWEQIDP